MIWPHIWKMKLVLPLPKPAQHPRPFDGEQRPTCPHPLSPPITHCWYRRLLLKSAQCHGSSAQAHASDTAAGPTPSLSSVPHSSPLRQPLVSPASTRCPKKTASTTQSEQRGALGVISNAHLQPRPHYPTHTKLGPDWT